MRRISRYNGFTIVEMLVVIVIIGILAGILIPVLAGARDSANKASCASNLKQCGNGFMMYQEKYNGFFPHADNGFGGYGWYDKITEFLQDENMKQCPLSAKPPGVNRSYKMNFNMWKDSPNPPPAASGWGNTSFPRLSTIPDRVKRGYGGEGRINLKNIVFLLDGVENANLSIDKTAINNDTSIANRHSGGPNILYANFTAGWIDAQGIGIADDEAGWTAESVGLTQAYWGP